MNRHGEHAVVIGASMAGLVAAAAIAPHYDRVTIVERDALPDFPQHRRGVPQSKHAHGLQPGGLAALEQLYPGLTDELVAGGARSGDLTDLCGWYIGGGSLARVRSGERGVGLTRPFLEHHVRTRTKALGVVIRDQVEVLRPVVAAGTKRVIGLEIAPEGGRSEVLTTDLVVDASGKVSKLPRWLTELGFEAPAEDIVECRMVYLTRRWRPANNVMGEDILQVVGPAATPHFGVAIAQEDGSFIVTLGGLLDDGPARTDEAYLEFARSLPMPRISQLLDGAEPITALQPSHFPASRRRRYDKVRSMPEGLVALGDSIASFNPMYGQGMSVAALEALALRENLSAGRLNLRAYYKKAHRIEDVAWRISTGGDLRYPEVVGKRTPDMKLMNRYLDRLAVAARKDPVLARQFLLVAGFVERPESFFKPSIIWRVVRNGGARSGEVAQRTAARESAESPEWAVSE